MIYQIKNGAVELSATPILRKVNFEIRGTEKIAVVGRNGCGKTTLLRLIAGEIDLSRDENGELGAITKSPRLEVGYLKQNAFEDLSLTLDEEIQKIFAPIHELKARLDTLLARMENGEENVELLSAFDRAQRELEDRGGYFYEKEYNMLLSAFGFSLDDKKRTLSEFSGGQLTKLAFVRLLLSKPDVLLLDEPTNHLDITTVEWLEDYLKDYKRAVVVVSHDRMFLDKIAEVVYEIEYGETTRYVGNYSKFVELKEQAYEQRLKAYKAQRAEIARLEALIERFRDTPTKVSMTDSKLKQIEHMVKLSEPRKFDTKSFHADFTPNRETGKEVLSVNGLKIGYNTPLLEPVSFKVYKGSRIGIIGGNGLGKSTLLKTLVGALSPLGGAFSLGHQVDIGYFDHQMAQYQSPKSLLDELWDEFPTLSEREIRSSLGAFMFSQDDVYKTVSSLSGGERVRLALCRLLKKGPNFLILDEPTNHMDMIGRQTLESMLSEFSGTLLFVSHDRYFVKRLAQSLIVIENGKATLLPYTYDEYLEKRTQGTLNIEPQPVKAPEPQRQSASKEAYNQGKERARLERRVIKINEEIASLDEKIALAKEQMQSEQALSDYVRLMELSEQIDQHESSQMDLLEELDEIEKRLKEIST